MSLKVTYQSTPLAGTVLHFDDAATAIRVGRLENQDVRFPPEIAIVGREHFEIRRSAGTYKFAINARHRVFVDGRDVLDGQELRGATEIAIGRADGPSLLLEPHAAGQSILVPTEKQGESRQVWQITRDLRTRMGVGAAGLVILAILAFWQIYVAGQQQDLFAQLASRADFSAIVAQRQASVFLVADLDSKGDVRGSATAWVVGLPDGRRAFATNAHVGKMLEEAQKAGRTLIVRSPDAAHTEFRIEEAVIHPAYDAFEAFKAAADDRAKAVPQLIRAMKLAPSYDVALLIPETQSGIPEPLPLAGDVALAAIRAGQPIAMIGYPAGNLINADLNAPSATVQVGVVTAVRDFFLASDGTAQLIEHSIPATQGASGAPILNQQGEVIGLLNGGNVVIPTVLNSETQRQESWVVPNAALINFGQRVDLLKELIDRTADAKLVEYTAQWELGSQRWLRDPQRVFQEYVDNFRRSVGEVQSVSLQGQTGEGNSVFPKRSAALRQFAFKAGVQYLLTVQSPDAGNMTVHLIDEEAGTLLDTQVIVNLGSVAIMLISPLPSDRNVQLAFVSGETGSDGNVIPVSYDAQLHWPLKPP